METTENSVEQKRKADDDLDEDGEEEGTDWVGPMPSEASKTKKRKGECSDSN